MKPNYAEALAGTLVSPSGTVPGWYWTLKNLLTFPISVSIVTNTRQLVPQIWVLAEAQYIELPPDNNPHPPGTFVVISSQATGAFVCVITMDPANSGASFISADLLSDQNDIGPIPQPSTDILIPPDSPSVVVAQGQLPNKNLITREQCWRRMPDSHTIAPGETRTVGSSISSGMTQTTSDQSTVSSSVSTSVSAGWGPVSASVSASLSQSSTSMHSLTVSEQSTSYESSVLTSTKPNPVMMLRWQICDTINILDGSGAAPTYAPIASIVSLLQPSYLQDYDLTNLPPAKQKPPMSEESKQWWLKQMDANRAIGQKSKSPAKKKAKQRAKK